MPPFKYGTKINYKHGLKGKDGKLREKPAKYLRISAGPMRGRYVHDVVMEAKLGRKLIGDETVEHADGNGLNPDPDNLTVVSRKLNTELRWARERKARDEEARKEASEMIKAAGMREPWADQF